MSLDLDVAVAADQLPLVERVLQSEFKVERFPHSLNVSAPDSALRIQIQIDLRYAAFVARSAVRDVLGHEMPVAELVDVLQGKVWAAEDETRWPSNARRISPISRGSWKLGPTFAQWFHKVSCGDWCRRSPNRERTPCYRSSMCCSLLA